MGSTKPENGDMSLLPNISREKLQYSKRKINTLNYFPNVDPDFPAYSDTVYSETPLTVTLLAHRK